MNFSYKTQEEHLRQMLQDGYSLEEAFMLKDGNYLLVFTGCRGDQFRHPEFPGLELDLNKVFYRPPAGT